MSNFRVPFVDRDTELTNYSSTASLDAYRHGNQLAGKSSPFFDLRRGGNLVSTAAVRIRSEHGRAIRNGILPVAFAAVAKRHGLSTIRYTYTAGRSPVDWELLSSRGG